MFSFNCKGRLLTIDYPIIMAIINVTPDSFFSGSRKTNITELLLMAAKMIGDGAVILDIGGQSTRPGSTALEAEQELKRVIPAVEALRKKFNDVFISIDTYHSIVAELAVRSFLIQ